MTKITMETGSYHDLPTILTYAKMLRNTHVPFRPVPTGWERIKKVTIPVAGFYAIIYSTGTETVVSISGQRPHRPLFLLDMLIRRRWLQKYSKRISKWAENFLKVWPNVTFIGASGGGGVAAWLGHLYDRPAVTFNAGRTELSLLGDGEKTDVVFVKGDKWGDPYDGVLNIGPIPGHEIILEPIPGENTHHMSIIIQILESELAP